MTRPWIHTEAEHVVHDTGECIEVKCVGCEFRIWADCANVRAILAQHRVGFPSDKLLGWYQR